MNGIKSRSRLVVGAAAVIVAGLAVFAGAGAAASQAKPVNTTPPQITGTPQEGQTLHGSKGQWTNNPSDYNYYWLRCDHNGGSCANINGAGGSQNYKLTTADVGNTLRFRVQATNGDGSTSATSVPTAVIQKATAPPPPPPSNGCPSTTNPAQVTAMSPPARLEIDQWQPQPTVITRGTQSWVFRVHVTSTCGGSVQGALVYGTATPFNQFTVPAEQATGSDGWASLTFNRLTGFPASNKQGILAMFLRARKSGENVMAGITGYRLVSVDVNLSS